MNVLASSSGSGAPFGNGRTVYCAYNHHPLRKIEWPTRSIPCLHYWPTARIAFLPPIAHHRHPDFSRSPIFSALESSAGCRKASRTAVAIHAVITPPTSRCLTAETTYPGPRGVPVFPEQNGKKCSSRRVICATSCPHPDRSDVSPPAGFDHRSTTASRVLQPLAVLPRLRTPEDRLRRTRVRAPAGRRLKTASRRCARSGRQLEQRLYISSSGECPLRMSMICHLRLHRSE